MKDDWSDFEEEYDWSDWDCEGENDSEEQGLTENDYAMLAYFIREKGDINRWGSWGKRKHLFEAKHPELIHTLDQIEMQMRILNAVLSKVLEEN